MACGAVARPVAVARSIPTAIPSSTATATQTVTPSATPVPTATPHPLSIAALRQGEYPGSKLAVEQPLEAGINYARSIVSYQSEGLKIYALLTVPLGVRPAAAGSCAARHVLASAGKTAGAGVRYGESNPVAQLLRMLHQQSQPLIQPLRTDVFNNARMVIPDALQILVVREHI